MSDRAFRSDDLIDFTPALQAEALKLVSKYKLGPMFTPPVVSKIDGPLATLSRAQAGTNWAGGSYDPETHMAYVFSSGAIGAYGLGAADQSKHVGHGIRARQCRFGS